MIVTARQLQDLQARDPSGDQIVLPYGARLTPLALDWAKSKRVKIGYGPAELAEAGHPASAPLGLASLLWWCDGPCGSAKAALAAQARESNLAPIQLPNDAAHLVPAIKYLASQVKSQQASSGVLLVKSAAEAIVYANRCPAIRAVVGTCVESVDQGISAVAANVLVIEYVYKNFSQVRNLLTRFARATRNLSDETRRRLEELATCA
ncbi:MAG TPA: RpiB/LacA/LacB family sugar-phosphate isomerase [Tepidisphaeraceae bacterium]|jgi:hypothetical protein|nr:RpiB/LacA/LacB family sugar-phosphate isomerase [Tepidisphaeraceae bacterium]